MPARERHGKSCRSTDVRLFLAVDYIAGSIKYQRHIRSESPHKIVLRMVGVESESSIVAAKYDDRSGDRLPLVANLETSTILGLELNTAVFET